MKKFLKPLIYPLAIGIILWEELAYKPITKITNFLEKNQIIHKISEKIRKANPYVALGILLSAGLPLLPFKIGGLWLIGHGYKLLGVGTFAMAKVIGGGIGVHLFNLTEPAIRKIERVDNFLNFVFTTKNKIKKVIEENETYQNIKSKIHESKIIIKEILNPIMNKLKPQRVEPQITKELFNKDKWEESLIVRISDKKQILEDKMEINSDLLIRENEKSNSVKNKNKF